MSRIFISGSLAYDRIMVFPGLFKDHFLPDKLHNINVSFYVPKHTEHFGGTAGNIAYNLVLLEERPTIIGTVGGDFDKYREYLESLGIDTSSIHVAPQETTAFAYIMTDKADNQISAFHPGAGAIFYGSDIATEVGSIAIIGAGCLDDIREQPEIYRKKGVRFLFDPGQSIVALSGEDLKNGMKGAEAVLLNDYELAMISEKTGWKEADILKVAHTLVITLGKEGSRVITKNGEERVKAVEAKEVLDPTGAGDAYRAGYIKGMLSGKSAVECARLGSTVAVFAVEIVGTQEHTFTPRDLHERYRQAFGEEWTQ